MAGGAGALSVSTSRLCAAVVAVALQQLACAQDPICNLAGCWDRILLSVVMPERLGTYEVAFETDFGSTVCSVPVGTKGLPACEDEGVVRVEREDARVRFSLLETDSATILLSLGGEVVVQERLTVEPADFDPIPGTDKSCSGPCVEAHVRRDWSGLSP